MDATLEREYAVCFRNLSCLRAQQKQLENELLELATPITQAEALANKAREALLRSIEQGQ
jgi:hypothetical protein